MVPRIWLALMLALPLLLPPTSAGADPRSPSDAALGQACLTVAEGNLLDPGVGWLRPSPDYLDGDWLRDAFWASSLLGPSLGRRALDNFGRQLNAAGQAPTRLGLDGVGNQYLDDEPTLLYLLWAYRDGGQPPGRVLKAWSWVREHVVDGAYWTPPGGFHTWHDTFVFPERDVVAYNQGLYAAAALAASQLGIASRAEAEAAVAAYRRLYSDQLGYLRFSLALAYHDPSALVGEVLTRTLLGRPLLDDEAVLATVSSLPRAGPGFRVLAAGNGSGLPPSAFSPAASPGVYQNGGSWLLYDVLAWQAASLAGSPTAQASGRQRLAFEVASGSLHEYWIASAGELRAGVHRDYAWNAYACRALGLDGATGLADLRARLRLPVPN